MRKVYAYQQAHPYKEKDRSWIRATFYTGAMALYETTAAPAVLESIMQWAKENEWAVGDEGARVPANNMTCGQTYLELYFLKQDPAMIAKMRAYIDDQIASGEPGRKA